MKQKKCATSGCSELAANYFERGDLGTTYCPECYAKVVALKNPTITVSRADFERLVAAAEEIFRVTGPTWPTAGEANAVDELDAALAPFRKEKMP